MAIRQKTIEYNFDSVITPVSNMTGNTSSVLMVHIPETGSRTFQSVWLKTCMRDSNSATTGRGSFQKSTTTLIFNGIGTEEKVTNYHNSRIDTGEQIPIEIIDSYTDDFNTYFTSSAVSMSATLWYSASLSSPEFTNIERRLYITYTFDDTNTDTRIKTVRIPMEYFTSSIPRLPMPIPYNGGIPQIPALDTFCPESNKTFRNIWIEFKGLERDAGSRADDSYLSASLDNGPYTTVGFFENANISEIPFLSSYKLNNMDTTTTHSLWLYATGSSNFKQVSPILYATYEYNHTNSIRILNSIIGVFNYPGFYGFNQYPVQYTYPFVVPEDNPELKQSALVFYVSSTSTLGPEFRIRNITGSITQSNGSYDLSGYFFAIGSTLGMGCIPMRIDSQSMFYPRTSSISPLVKGRNEINSICIGLLNNSRGNRGNSPLAVVYLNYESDKHSDGTEVHNKTIMRLQSSGSVWSANNYRLVLPIKNSYNVIPETDYYIQDFSYYMMYQRPTTSGRSINNYITPVININDYINNNEKGYFMPQQIEDGISTAHVGIENSTLDSFLPDQSKVFRKYPGQLTGNINNPFEGTLNPQTTRSFICTLDSINHAFADCVTYHSICLPLTGTISGYTGDGSGITVTLHDAKTHKALKSATTTAGGAYTMSWYDPSQELYVESIQDATRTGRSANGTV